MLSQKKYFYSKFLSVTSFEKHLMINLPGMITG